MIGLKQFGTTCRNMMLRVGMPMARAASTYSLFLTVMTAVRVVLATTTNRDTAMAMISDWVLCPRADTTTMPIKRPGMERKISRMRMMNRSTLPPKKPQTAPIGMPTSKDSATVAKPIASEYRAPYMTRENRSRPMSSVPNQCAAFGACRRSFSTYPTTFVS